MITKALKQNGFYGWKDYWAFAMGRIVAPVFDNDFVNFAQKVFYDRSKAMIGFLDPLKINEIIEQIHKLGKVYFLFDDGEKTIVNWYINMFRKFGVEAHFLNINNDEYKIINSGVAIVHNNNKQINEEVVNFLIAERNETKVVNIRQGYVENNPQAIDLPIIEESASQNVQKLVFEFQKKYILNAVLDYIFTRWYSKYVDKITYSDMS